MTAHSVRAYLTPIDRLSPIARRYLQSSRHIPVHPHSVRRLQTGLYQAQTLNITPLELTIFLLSAGAIIGLLFFFCFIAIQHCISATKRRFNSKKNTSPVPCQRRRSSCERFYQQQTSTATRIPEALEGAGSSLGPSKHATYGTLEGEGEQITSKHPVGKRVGYYEGISPWNESERQEHGDGMRDSASSGRLTVHRDDCEQSCGKRRRSIDHFIV